MRMVQISWHTAVKPFRGVAKSSQGAQGPLPLPCRSWGPERVPKGPPRGYLLRHKLVLKQLAELKEGRIRSSEPFSSLQWAPSDLG